MHINLAFDLFPFIYRVLDERFYQTVEGAQVVQTHREHLSTLLENGFYFHKGTVSALCITLMHKNGDSLPL